MHPLPRTDELAYELDSDPRAVYFEQAAAGVPVRMALIAWLLEKNGTSASRLRPAPDSLKAENAPALFQSQLHQPPRKPLPRAALQARRRRQPFRTLPALRVLRARTQGAVRRPFAQPSLLQVRRKPLGYVRQWLEDGTLVVFETVKQAEESGLRTVPARSSARDHERGGNRRAATRSRRKSSATCPIWRASRGRNRQPRRDAGDAPVRADRAADQGADSVRRAGCVPRRGGFQPLGGGGHRIQRGRANSRSKTAPSC